jgi:hypothetical protein
MASDGAIMSMARKREDIFMVHLEDGRFAKSDCGWICANRSDREILDVMIR